METDVILHYLGKEFQNDRPLYWFLFGNKLVCHSTDEAIDFVRSIPVAERDCKVGFDMITNKRACTRMPAPRPLADRLV